MQIFCVSIFQKPASYEGKIEWILTCGVVGQFSNEGLLYLQWYTDASQNDTAYRQISQKHIRAVIGFPVPVEKCQ